MCVLELGTADYYKFKDVMHQRSFILEQKNPFPVEGGSHARVTGQFLRARNPVYTQTSKFIPPA